MSFLTSFIARLFRFLTFSVFVFYEIILANFRVAYDVLTPRYRAKPALLYVPLDCSSDLQRTWLAIVISLTPGTLALEITEDKHNLLLHSMYCEDEKALVAEIKRKFERPIMEILQ